MRLWSIWDPADTDNKDLNSVAKERIDEMCERIKRLSDAASTLQTLFWQRMAKEDFLNRQRAISTMQRRMRS